MDEQEYVKLLDRAYTRIPQGFHDTERWKIPQVNLEFEGKNTIIQNYKEIIDAIRRDSAHFFKTILQEIGTSGEVKMPKAILKGKQKKVNLDRLIENYCVKYVICETCGKPDTHVEKDGRQHVLVCAACGTRRPVKF